MNIHGINIQSYIKENRKTTSISINPKGEVSLKAPLCIKDEEVYDFVLRKKVWIQKKLEHFAQFKDVHQGPLTEGKSILYLGNEYQLKVYDKVDKEGIELDNDSLTIFTAQKDNTRHNDRLLRQWLLTQAERIFHERLSLMLKKFNDLPRPVLKIRKYKGRWGSYASNHVMTLNSVLIHADLASIDYIITHELCHYYHRGHKSDFYDLLSQKMPQWKSIKNNLNNGRLSLI